MRLAKKSSADMAECDMTPMIDMTFQLIAFFMVLINFSDAQQDQRINLPTSELAKPPDAPFEEPLYVQLTKKNVVLFAGDEVSVAGLGKLLTRERQVIERNPDKSVSMVTIIIRADGDAKTGQVQEIIKTCQETGFEKFALRAQQEERQ
jgi:biopolymer transport protein ExbD